MTPEVARPVRSEMVSSGVRMQVWRLPAELNESRIGPPLTPDDLLDFHLLLQEDGWFDRLSEHVNPSAS